MSLIPVDKALENINGARYGEEVRKSIHDAIYIMNENATEAVDVAEKSQTSAKASADSAKISAQEAKDAADEAKAIVGIGIATTSKAGIVKPDGTTINVATDGQISVPIDNDTIYLQNGVLKSKGGGGGSVSGGSVLHIHTRDFVGFDVTVVDSDPDTGEIETQTAKFDNNGIATFHVVGSGVATVSVTDTDGKVYTSSVNMTYYGIYTASVNRFSATVTVNTEENAVVTASDGTNTYTATSVGGVASLRIGNAGSFNISANVDGITSGDMKSVTISSSGETKTITIAFASIEISFVGTLIASVTNGTFTKTINDSTGNVKIYVPSTAEYIITGTLDGDLFNETKVNVTEYINFEVEVTLKSFFADWLVSGGITTPYSTLDELLAEGTQNEKDVRQLMTKHASCDKLIEWYNDNPTKFPLSKFTNSRIAMKWIGLRDYICDKLLAITDIKNAILDSQFCYTYVLFQATTDVPILEVDGATSGYGRKLYINVPLMTTKTEPLGQIRVSAEQGGGHDSVQAFNKTYATSNWWSAGGVGNAWISYEFTRPMMLKRFYLKPYNNSKTEGKDITLLGSNSGLDTEWIPIFTHTLAGSGEAKDHNWDKELNVAEPYKFYKVMINGTYNSAYVAMTEIDFYGVDYSEREFETDSTYLPIYDNGIEFVPLYLQNLATKKTDCFNLGNNQTGAPFITTDNPVDFTGRTILRAKSNGTFVNSGGNKVTMGISDNKPISTSAGGWIGYNDRAKNELFYPYGSVSGEKYPFFGWGANVTSDIDINEWWLE